MLKRKLAYAALGVGISVLTTNITTPLLYETYHAYWGLAEWGMIVLPFAFILVAFIGFWLKSGAGIIRRFEELSKGAQNIIALGVALLLSALVSIFSGANVLHFTLLSERRYFGIIAVFLIFALYVGYSTADEEPA